MTFNIEPDLIFFPGNLWLFFLTFLNALKYGVDKVAYQGKPGKSILGVLYVVFLALENILVEWKMNRYLGQHVEKQ